MELAVKVNDLTKTYKEFKLNHIDFNLPTGTIMGFIGENGAGKTTTIKLLLNMIKKDNGSIELLGMDPAVDDQKIKEQIGVVLDECYFYTDFSPRDISKVMGKIFKMWDEKLFCSYLTRFSIPENRPLKELSKGMKAKLQIATALSHHPKLLIMDEATSGLDPVIRNEILDLFLEFIQDENHSILLSSHITSDLERIADYITFIHKGEILVSRSKDEILEQYGILKCGQEEFSNIEKSDYVCMRNNSFGYELLVEDKKMIRHKYPHAILDPITLEELMLFYIGRK